MRTTGAVCETPATRVGVVVVGAAVVVVAGAAVVDVVLVEVVVVLVEVVVVDDVVDVDAVVGATVVDVVVVGAAVVVVLLVVVVVVVAGSASTLISAVDNSLSVPSVPTADTVIERTPTVPSDVNPNACTSRAANSKLVGVTLLNVTVVVSPATTT